MSEILPAHSKIGASSYTRWSSTNNGCPGSVKMSEGCPNISSAYADEGTHAHTVSSQELEKYFFGLEPKDGWLAASKEMREATDVYVNFVKQTAVEFKANTKLGHILIEHKFDLSSVHPGLFGTADAVIYSPAFKKLTVIDYKHGAGIAVDVDDNLQLQYYGLGALLSTKFPCNTVELVIVQPRCEHPDGPIRKWEFKSVALLDFAADLAYDAAETEKPNAKLNPGKHCRFCPAAATKCPAIKNKALELAKLEFSPALSYDPAKLAETLKYLPAIEGWIKKVREFAYGEAVAGNPPPGWKMVAKRATRKWNATETEILNFMNSVTRKEETEFFNRELKSPAQMEKFLSKQLGEKLREMMISVSSGYNLVPASDPRPLAKIDPTSEFTKIEGESDG